VYIIDPESVINTYWYCFIWK